MAGPWEKYQAPEQSTDTGPWNRYQAATNDSSAQSQPGDYVSDTERRYGIPSGLLRAVISKESSGNSGAVSPKGAIGLTQVMPATARSMGYDPAELARNPEMQVDAGARYLKQMLESHGNVSDALAAYNWGPGNMQKFARGEKNAMPRETLNYISDPRFAQWTQPNSASGDDELGQLLQQSQQPAAQPRPSPSFSEYAAETGRGLVQSAVNVANIPNSIENAGADAVRWLGGRLGGSVGQALINDANRPGVTDAVKGAAAAIGNQIGIGDGTYIPGGGFQLPEGMRPTDPYAKLAAEIGPYLIPGIGAERTAVAMSSVANAGRAERFATHAADMLAENLPGALAQNSGNNQSGLAGDLALGVVGSGAVRAARPVAGKIIDTVNGMRPAAREASTLPDSAATPLTESPAVNDTAARYAQAAQAGGDGRIAQVVNDIRPDQNVVDAMQRLDINPDDMLEAYTSGSDAFKAVQMGLASQDESALAAVKRDSINRISQRAAKIIDDAGAMPDRLAMDDAFKAKFNETRNALKNQENELYTPIHDAIPARQEVSPDYTRDLLDSMSDDLGGYQHLSPVEKRVYESVSPTTDRSGGMTYARLNNVRSVVGAELRKQGTPFGSAEERNLSRLYSALTNDRDAVARAFGFGEQVKLANAVTAQRKMMEERMYSLLGRDLSGDVTVKSKNALTGLASGDTKSFTQLMRTVPDRADRAQLIATGMRDMLRQGSRSDLANNINGFVDYYGALKRSGGIRLLHRELPPHTVRELDDFYTLARNVKSANQYHIPTGKLNGFLKKFEQSGGFLDKLATHGKMAAIATILGHVPIAGPVLSTATAAQMGANAAARKSGAAAVNELMTSPVWKNLAAAARGNPPAPAQDMLIKRAEKQIMNSRAWKMFYRTLPKREKNTIARIGIIAWLSGDGDE